jgi:hypothetical protein
VVKLVKWEEPGWVGKAAVEDPDGHHKVAAKSRFFMSFDGRIGRHPGSHMDWGRLKRFGQSPENAPFKTNIEQHFTFERPRLFRIWSDREGRKPPHFKGDEKTPQWEMPGGSIDVSEPGRGGT